MNCADLLGRLLRRNPLVLAALLLLAVVAGVLTGYTPKTGPLRLEKRGVEFGAASAQILVDGFQSPLSDATVPVGGFSDRARAYADFFQSDSVRFEVAHDLGIKPEALVMTSQIPRNIPVSELVARGAERAVQVREEGAPYSLLYRVNPSSPIVQIFTEAPTGDQAIRLADSATVAVARLVGSLQQDRTPGGLVRRVVIRPLGRAYGGTVNPGASVTAAILAGLGTLVGGCVILLLLDGVRLGSPSVAAGPKETGQPLT